MTIRAATLDDLPDIVACAERAFLPVKASSQDAHAGHYDDLLEQIRLRNLHVISEGNDPTIVGYISLIPVADHVFVDSIAVRPEYHAKGFGTHLLTFAELEAERLGLGSVRLYTQQTSADGFAFYRKRGYTETDRCDSDGFPRVFYCKVVSRNSGAASASRFG